METLKFMFGFGMLCTQTYLFCKYYSYFPIAIGYIVSMSVFVYTFVKEYKKA
jgi:thiol:disulfide interchange protein